MVSCEHLIAKPDELLASVLAAHSNVGILQTQSKGVRKPAVGVLSCHDPGLPDAVKLPVRLDAQVPEVSVRRHAHRLIGAGMRCHIGVARGVVVTDIEFPIVLAVAVDCAGLVSFFFSKGSSPFLRSTRVHSKNRGVPPVASKRNL